MKTDKGGKNFVDFIAFIGLAIYATLLIFGFLNHMGWLGAITGTIPNIFNTLKNACVILVIGVSAFRFISGKSKGWIITYWICLVIALVFAGLIWIPA